MTKFDIDLNSNKSCVLRPIDTNNTNYWLFFDCGEYTTETDDHEQDHMCISKEDFDKCMEFFEYLNDIMKSGSLYAYTESHDMNYISMGIDVIINIEISKPITDYIFNGKYAIAEMVTFNTFGKTNSLSLSDKDNHIYLGVLY